MVLEKRTFLKLVKKFSKNVSTKLEWGWGGTALVTGPLKKEFLFFAADLTISE